MKITAFQPKDTSIGSTRTYAHFYTYLKAKPKMLGMIAENYANTTPLLLTERLGNVFYNGSNKLNDFQPIDTMVYEWALKTSYYKRVEFADRPRDVGGEGGSYIFAFKENYYQKYDIGVIDDSHQQFQVLSTPVRKGDNWWEVEVRIVSSDRNAKLNVSYCNKGSKTHFISNAMPELSEEGYTKRHSNIEKHRNWITTFRCDIDYSREYALTQGSFCATIKRDKKGEMGNKKCDDVWFEMDGVEKELLESFQYARSTGLLLNKSNIDMSGKPTIQETSANRDIIIGDGLIPQIERYCPKQVYNNFSISILNNIIYTLEERVDTTKNHWLFTVNNKLNKDINDVMLNVLKGSHTDGAWFWSRKNAGYVHVGSSFSSYEYMGNTITFVVDKALNNEYKNKGYGVCLNVSPDKTKGLPAISLFSLEGKQFVYNSITGVGGKDGMTSGDVSSHVAGSKLVAIGSAGIGVMNPYNTFIIREA